MKLDLNAMAARVHEANKKWWVDITKPDMPRIERNMGEMCMLVESELSEALEGHRKNLMDDKLPHRKMAEVELADALIRVLDICGGFKISLHRNAASEIVPVDRAVYNFGEQLLLLSRDIGNFYGSRNAFVMHCFIVNLFNLAHWEGFDLMAAYEEKMTYNATRHDHSIAGRLAENGKKY